MNTPLTFLEAVKLLEELPTLEAVKHAALNEFVDSVSSTGKNILGSLDDSGEYIERVSLFLLSAVSAECVVSGDLDDLAVYQVLQSDPEMFQLILGYAFIYAVGLAAVEELR